jgi:protein O-GlcNAc transferase
MQKKPSLTAVPIVNDVTVVVPDTIQAMTPYVLREQGDWFEDEIRFLRTLIRPGMQILDVGANYGLYALSLARLLQGNGAIWAFEPTSAVAGCLARSIRQNGFTATITLIRAALSDHAGTARLSLNGNPELNSLQPAQGTASTSELVTLNTLDAYYDTYQWGQIDFFKLDAEGEELRILDGARRFLAQRSPLIMYELKHGKVVNLPLIEKFEAVGYASFKLVIGLNLLIPFNKQENVDPWQLNLFCCKPETANQLEAQGFCLAALPTDRLADPVAEGDACWRDYLAAAPFARALLARMQADAAAPVPAGSDVYQRALNSYVKSQCAGAPAADRYRWLCHAYRDLCDIVVAAPSLARLVTLSRVARELGRREHALRCLVVLINQLSAMATAPCNEPLLPATKRFEAIDPEQRFNEWLASSLLEAYEELHAFSSYFTNQSSQDLLLKLKSLGFMSGRMERRLELIKQRFAQSVVP